MPLALLECGAPVDFLLLSFIALSAGATGQHEHPAGQDTAPRHLLSSPHLPRRGGRHLNCVLRSRVF